MERLIVTLLGLMSLFYFASGIALYFFSQQTFDSMPSYYGAFNNHFIKDAGLAFASSGILLVFAIIKKPERFIYSFCASLFVVLHGLFHVKMLFSGMVPDDYLPYELLQVIIPAFVLMILVGVIYRQQKA